MAVDYRSRQLRKYQNDFTTRFAQMMSKQLSIWKEVQKQKCKNLYNWQSILTYIGISLLAYIPGKRETHYNLELHFYLSIVFFIGAVIQNIASTNKDYQNSIKSMLFPALVKVFGDDIHYVCGNIYDMTDALSSGFLNSKDAANIITALGEESNSNSGYRIRDNIFETSQLYPREITQREDDDRFYGKYNDVEFIINETDFGWNENDKHRTYHSMFKGVAMHFKLNKEIKQRVLIMSKKIFNKVPKGFEKVEVEYTKFAQKYNVYVFNSGTSTDSGQIEARYLLNTAFLDRFMQLHTSFAVPKLQCSVYENQMLIMLSTRKDLFELNHLFGRIDDIKQYKHLFEEFASVLSFIDVLNLSSKTKL